jgi:hypothetical protein
VGDIDTAAMDSLKGLDPERSIREADITASRRPFGNDPGFSRDLAEGFDGSLCRR